MIAAAVSNRGYRHSGGYFWLLYLHLAGAGHFAGCVGRALEDAPDHVETTNNVLTMERALLQTKAAAWPHRRLVSRK